MTITTSSTLAEFGAYLMGSMVITFFAAYYWSRAAKFLRDLGRST